MGLNQEEIYFKEEVDKLLTEDFNDKDSEVKIEPQISIYDVMKKWYNLVRKYKNNKERFYGYFFDEETNVTYRVTNIYISNVTSYDDNGDEK